MALGGLSLYLSLSVPIPTFPPASHPRHPSLYLDPSSCPPAQVPPSSKMLPLMFNLFSSRAFPWAFTQAQASPLTSSHIPRGPRLLAGFSPGSAKKKHEIKPPPTANPQGLCSLPSAGLPAASSILTISQLENKLEKKFIFVALLRNTVHTLDMSLSQLREMGEGQGSLAAVHGVAKNGTRLSNNVQNSTEQHNVQKVTFPNLKCVI